MEISRERQSAGSERKRTVDEIAARAEAEGKKLAKYGRIGQRVRVVGRSISQEGEVVGVIIGIDSNLPFDRERIESWRQNALASEEGIFEGLPTSTVKIFVTEGKRRGQVVAGLKNSEWEPIE